MTIKLSGQTETTTNAVIDANRNGKGHHGYDRRESTTTDANAAWSQLALAADVGSEPLFLEAKRQIDWDSRSDDEFVQAIRWALASGVYLSARWLVERGTKLHPNHQELQKLALVLAPPRVVKRNLPPQPMIELDRQWLLTHHKEYQGKWVALRQGELLAAADMLTDVTSHTSVEPGTLFTQVL